MDEIQTCNIRFRKIILNIQVQCDLKKCLLLSNKKKLQKLDQSTKRESFT